MLVYYVKAKSCSVFRVLMLLLLLNHFDIVNPDVPSF